MALSGRPASDSVQRKYTSNVIISLSLMHEWRRLNTYFRKTVPFCSNTPLVWPSNFSLNTWFSGKRRKSLFSLHEEPGKEEGSPFPSTIALIQSRILLSLFPPVHYSALSMILKVGSVKHCKERQWKNSGTFYLHTSVVIADNSKVVKYLDL